MNKKKFFYCFRRACELSGQAFGPKMESQPSPNWVRLGPGRWSGPPMNTSTNQWLGLEPAQPKYQQPRPTKVVLLKNNK